MVRNGNEYGKSNVMSVTRQPFPIQIKTDKNKRRKWNIAAVWVAK